MTTNKKNTVIRILELLKTEKREVFFLLILIVFAAGADIVVPLISQNLIDKLINFFKDGGNTPIAILIWSAAGIFVATIAGSAVRAMYDYRLFMAVTQIEDALKYKVVQKYLRLHVLFHHGSSSGQIIGRIERGASGIYAILHDIFGHNLLPSLVILLGVFGLLLFKNIWIAFVVFLPLPLYILSVRRITERIYHIERRVNDEFEAVSKESYDVAANVQTVKKFSQEEEETKNQIKLTKNARDTQYSAERLWKILETIQASFSTLGRIIVILVAGFLVLKSISTIGEFVLYITLQNMVYAPLAHMSVIFPRLRRNTARVERLFEILDEPILVSDKPDAKILPPHKKSIEFQNVSFRYNPAGRWVIKNATVRIPVGTTTALVGRSGSGKTTFINLLLRSFDPQTGKVLVDGYDIRDIARESLLTQIAVVPQEVDLFSRTIYQNIAYGKPETTREAVAQAARTALAHDFIEKTEHGYDTSVGERGIKLSGGERQRVGIARAVLRDPRILILDEATSHLDTESERLIAQATDNLIKDRTTIVIAHRLSTILHADQIVVFRGGAIEAVGTHDELLRASPTYKRLYTLQFSDEE